MATQKLTLQKWQGNAPVSQATLARRGFYSGVALAKSPSASVAALGIGRKVRPGGTSIEQIVDCLRYISLEAEDCPLDFSTFQVGSIEMLGGLFWAVKLEWGDLVKFKYPYDIISPGLRNKAKFKAASKVCGGWIQTVLHLCEKVSTYAEAETGKAVSSLTIFRLVLEDVARAGGVPGALMGAYDWKPSAKTYDSKQSLTDLNSVCSRFKALEKPSLPGNSFNNFVAVSMELAEQNSMVQKGTFKAFHAATRKYIKSLEGDRAAISVKAIDGKGGFHWQMSSGLGRGMTIVERPK